jgi:2-methylisocitrate lyase-like PEP mutase family enzyme
MNQARHLRSLLGGEGMIVAPGAYDCLTAKLIESAGFAAVYMTGAGTAASLGFPDFGLVTLSEMAGNAGRIAAAVDVPVIADADTGYGNELNTVRTVREYEARGVAALHIEDQDFPKRCGHLDGKRIVAREDWLIKIRAASSARRDPSFAIIARTDARAVAGFDEAIARANAALLEGADMAFVEAPQSLDEIAAVPRLVAGPCLLNVVRGGKSPEIALADAEGFGYKLAIVPGLLLKTVIAACEGMLDALKTTGRYPRPQREMTVREVFARSGADEWEALGESLAKPAGAREAAQ